ncbi:hypothetical protein LF845_07955 [Deferribacterales bacterium Es71-Z0220]|uniref:sensor histidine kinase n=1 Tax=Deferrivibrio essentukiensis TaxID=2880922 RepID=UPI001F608476|nr:ATP-binding protein [Deferrivibrio essentukiensis]MCB4204890.1 hypothetical protein [Deferrivibrio essentukiensis]
MKFKLKLFLSMLFVVLAISFGIFFMVSNYTKISMREEADKISISFAKVTANMIANDLLLSDLLKIEKSLSKIKKTNNGIEYIYILDENRNILVSTFGEYIPVGIETWNNLEGKDTNVVLLKNKKEIIHDVGVKIIDNLDYEMHLGFTENSIEFLFKRVMDKFIQYIILIVIIVLILSYLLSNFLTKPLSDLYHFANKLMNKEFGVTTTPSGSLEVRKIIETLNNLSIELKRYHDNFKHTFNNLLLTEKISAFNTLKSGILHEIKSSITSIKLLVSGLNENNIKNDDIAIIRDETNNIEELLKKLTGQFVVSEIDIGFVNIHEIIENVLMEFKDSILQKKVAVNYNQSSEIKYIKGYFPLLELLFYNLVRNSLEAIESNGFINISTKYLDEGVEIIFSDSGKGISTVNLSKVFDPFFTTKKDGTGMGLYIVYNIVKIHYGDIAVESKANLTSFRILLRGTI